ncbi:gamma-glutamyltransferase family protein [Oleidesulfovibrio alaskensis]
MKSSLPVFEFASRRSPVYAPEVMVAASQPLAVSAGLDIAARGGSAADMAVAVAAVLAVVEPCSTGLGGDAFALYYDSATQHVAALNGSGKSGGGHTPEAVFSAGYDAVPARHGLAVTVPGACAAWCELHRKYGRLDLAEVLAPAVRLARDGFAVGPITARLWATEEALLRGSEGGKSLLVRGRAPRAGERIRNHALARLLKNIARKGTAALYEGAAAAALADAVQAAGGVLTADDMSRCRAQWQTPASTVYGGVRVHECPPNGQGLVALSALNILAALSDKIKGAPVSAERLHCMIESLRLGFADGAAYIADPDFSAVPADGLLSGEYAAARAALIDSGRALPQAVCGVPQSSSDTVQFCVTDRDGNACSMVNSIYMTFGSGVVVPSLGMALQNRGHNFVLRQDHPNCLAPYKRPYHTIIPCLTTHENGELHGVMGVMGGFMQPQGHVQILSALLDDGCNPQQALDRLRFCIQPDGAASVVALEEGMDAVLADSLKARGHDVRPVSGYARDLFGRGQIILRQPNGFWEAGSDGRADGLALGF